MDTLERSLSEVVACRDWDTTRFFIEDDMSAVKEPESIVQKEKEKRHEVEDFYLDKFREYVKNSNQIARLQAKHDHIRTVLSANGQGNTGTAGVSAADGTGQTTMTRKPQSHRR